jgi:hypothetical protein
MQSQQKIRNEIMVTPLVVKILSVSLRPEIYDIRFTIYEVRFIKEDGIWIMDAFSLKSKDRINLTN